MAEAHFATGDTEPVGDHVAHGNAERCRNQTALGSVGKPFTCEWTPEEDLQHIGTDLVAQMQIGLDRFARTVALAAAGQSANRAVRFIGLQILGISPEASMDSARPQVMQTA